MNRTIHPSKSYNLKDWRKIKINVVNSLVRCGWSYKKIGEYLNVSPSTVQRYYYGFADNCLPYDGSGWNGYGRNPNSVIYRGASVDIIS